MSQKHSTMEDLLKKSKWINSERKVSNWPEFAKDMRWISFPPAQYGQKAKKYLPAALRDLGSYDNARAFYIDNQPLREVVSAVAILTDKLGSGNCWVRRVRIEDDQVFVTSPLWPHPEVPFPMDYFESIERVSRISFLEGV